MLGVAQEDIGRLQLVHHRGGQQLHVAQLIENNPQWALLQADFLTAANQLETLGDKFNFADTARAEFDVVMQAATRDLALDHRLHIAQRLNGGKVQIAAVGKRPQAGHQALICRFVTGNAARLDQRVALPVPALVLVVLFHGVEADHQRPALAIGSQPHIHAKHKAVGGARIQGLDQTLPKANKEFLIVDAARATRCAARFGIAENQVDV